MHDCPLRALAQLDSVTPLSLSTASSVTMRPTHTPGHKPPTDPSPLMATFLSDNTFDMEDFSGEPLGGTSASTAAASSSALMRRSVDSVFHDSESPFRQHIEHAPSDAGSDNAVLSARTNTPHGEITAYESDTASDFSDEDLWTPEHQETQDPAAASSYTTASAGLAPIHYFVAHTHAAPNGSPIARTRPITVDIWRPGPLDNATILTPLNWRVSRATGTFIYSPVNILVADVLRPQRDTEKQSGKLRNSANYTAYIASSHAGPNPALLGPPPKFILHKGRRELRRQNHQPPRAGQIEMHPSPPLRTVQVRRTKYVVPRILSRAGSFFNDDPFVTEPTPTVEQALSWSYERVLMTKEEYDQKVAAMVDEETSISTPLHNDPFPVSAQYTHISNATISSQSRGGCSTQYSLGSGSHAAAKFTGAIFPFAQIPQPELSSTDRNILEDIDEGLEESVRQSNQDKQASLALNASGRPSSPKKNRVQAAVFAARRTSLKGQLADVEVERKAVLQREQDETDAWQASAPFEGAQLLEEVQKFTTAAKERTELRLRVLGWKSQAIQGRLNRLDFISRNGNGSPHQYQL
ncbi:hypothetical protein P171DRAFT_446614 [Karstenula rhodostoma CBS 690.94]|uniref:Uncharacterized protein n=1 Tax=Karstenula rhodostoma CBS 690.94 TaxID=1392251 RepID=A0A9P4U9A3_9PLEO|nr:hypothetical protein P171DRAFT_446614 [Karstenula rhodostoma CBS 690.94]